MKPWNNWSAKDGRPVAGLIDVRYADGKEFYAKRAEDCYWSWDSLIVAWRHHEQGEGK